MWRRCLNSMATYRNCCETSLIVHWVSHPLSFSGRGWHLKDYRNPQSSISHFIFTLFFRTQSMLWRRRTMSYITWWCRHRRKVKNQKVKMGLTQRGAATWSVLVKFWSVNLEFSPQIFRGVYLGTKMKTGQLIFSDLCWACNDQYFLIFVSYSVHRWNRWTHPFAS